MTARTSSTPTTTPTTTPTVPAQRQGHRKDGPATGPVTGPLRVIEVVTGPIVKVVSATTGSLKAVSRYAGLAHLLHQLAIVPLGHLARPMLLSAIIAGFGTGLSLRVLQNPSAELITQLPGYLILVSAVFVLTSGLRSEIAQAATGRYIPRPQ